MMIIGCDYHPGFQQIAFVDTETGECGERQSTGALTMDNAFHDANGKPGFDFANRKWPHGWTGTGQPHGVVFSR